MACIEGVAIVGKNNEPLYTWASQNEVDELGFADISQQVAFHAALDCIEERIETSLVSRQLPVIKDRNVTTPHCVSHAQTPCTC